MGQSSQVDVCIIEDDADQQRLIARTLERAGFTVDCSGSIEEGIEHIIRKSPKVAIVDYELPDGNGIELCREIRKEPDLASIHLVLTTAFGDHGLKDAAIKNGVDDYLDKPVDHLDLVARIRVGVRLWSMQNRLRHAAITDGLTGLYNHDHFNRVLEAEMARAQRYGHPVAMIMVDVDHFKAVNDTYGHLVGNTVLESIARILREGAREVDTIGRFGGEEFAVILPEAVVAEAVHVAERMSLALSETRHADVLRDHPITATFGVCDSEDARVTTAACLVDLADRAMYLGKHRGRNQIVPATELGDWTSPAEMIQNDEVESLRRRLASLNAQSKDLYTNAIEALIQALDERDPYTARHARNVAFYAEQVAAQMGCSKATLRTLRNAGLLHDIGKIGIPDKVLLKQAALTPLERELMNQVPEIGVRIVGHLRILAAEIQVIRHQREYYDGSGVPNGLKGNQVPIASRILLVADAFDAMTTDRVYRPRRSMDDALCEIQSLSASQFDPRAVVALRQVIDRDRSAWQQRINETIQEMGPPSFERSPRKPDGVAAGS